MNEGERDVPGISGRGGALCANLHCDIAEYLDCDR